MSVNICYAVNGDVVRVLIIGNRNDGDVYKPWERSKEGGGKGRFGTPFLCASTRAVASRWLIDA